MSSAFFLPLFPERLAGKPLKRTEPPVPAHTYARGNACFSRAGINAFSARRLPAYRSSSSGEMPRYSATAHKSDARGSKPFCHARSRVSVNAVERISP